MIDLGKFNLLGVNINAIDYEATVQKIVEFAKQRNPLGVSALAVHGVMSGVMDVEHRHRLNEIDLVVPDGQPVRWAMNMIYQTKLNDRVYGPQLMLETCRAAAENGISIFLFGGRDDLLDELECNLVKRFSGLKIAGKMQSKFRPISRTEKQEIIETILKSGAGITFVGLGCPRQEVWTYEYKEHLRQPVLAVGAAFNFHAGRLAQAPPWMQRLGLEWLYRLCHEPRRLWRRYVLLNPYYLILLFLQWSGLKKFPPESTVRPQKEMMFG